jgi:hypothetical protein
VRDEQPRQRRPHDAGGVEHAGVERDRVHEVALADHLDEERLARRHVDRVGDAIDKGQDRHVPVLDVAELHEGGEAERLYEQHGLAGDDEPALRQAVGEGAGDERQQQHRRELQRADETETERRVGELEHEPGLGHRLHPGADERDELRNPEQTKVPVPERAQPSRQPGLW